MSLLSRIKKPVSEEPAEAEEGVRPRTRLIGEILRDRREELGLDLDSIGEALRIKPSYLAALEQGHSHELPGPAYAIGFVRAYARHLGFDSEKVLARFRAESSVLQSRPDLSLPVPLGERSLPGAAVLVVALILGLCGYGTWYYLSTDNHSRPERVAAVPAALEAASTASDADQPAANLPRPSVTASAGEAAPPPMAAPAGTAPATTPGAAGSAKMVSGLFGNQDDASSVAGGAGTAGPGGSAVSPTGSDAAPVSMAAASPKPDAATPGPPAAAPVAEAPKVQLASAAPAANAGSRIAIKAVSDCWIQVRAPDQSIVFSRVLKQGETYQVPAKSGLALRTGNAGALQIVVDGKAVPSIGSIGTLRRNVALDPDALLGGTAVHG